MEQSQRQAAAAVTRVLDGQSLRAALEASGADDAGPARAFIHELAYGTLRHYGTLDTLVRELADKPIPDRKLAALLAVALYQLLHTKAPPFAVVDQAVVAAAVVARPAAKGLVNAMLRRFLRERDAMLARANATPVGRWSHPRWWIARVRADWPAHWQAILDAGNQRPPLALRVNVRRTSREALLEHFAQHQVAARAEGADGVIVEVPRPVHDLPGFDDGMFSVQDLGAQLAAPLLGTASGMRVLDACAAPGGKTAHLLECADAGLTAIDSDAERLTRVRDNLARLRLEGAQVTLAQADAAQPAAWWDGRPFDRILADVPCTASGVVRRHPDGKWLRRPSDLAGFAKTQDAILDGLWTTLARGGLLLYATCSVFREENDVRVVQFIARTPAALRESISFDAPIAHSGGQLLPSPDTTGHNQDGFFYALLRKE